MSDNPFLRFALSSLLHHGPLTYRRDCSTLHDLHALGLVAPHASQPPTTGGVAYLRVHLTPAGRVQARLAASPPTTGPERAAWRRARAARLAAAKRCSCAEDVRRWRDGLAACLACNQPIPDESAAL